MSTDIDLTDWAKDAARAARDAVVWNRLDVAAATDIILHHADPLIAALQSAVEERDMLKRELEAYTEGNHYADSSNMVAKGEERMNKLKSCLFCGAEVDVKVQDGLIFPVCEHDEDCFFDGLLSDYAWDYIETFERQWNRRDSNATDTKG